MIKDKKIIITIDNEDLADYEKYYFSIHPRAQKKPIKHPFHESINVWMIMKRPKMNALKQKWKDFIIWLVNERGYTNLHINKCEISQTVYYPNNRRHDTDNSVPKFILDGLVESGMIIDDDSAHVTKLTLMCATDIERPRTELHITVLDNSISRIKGGI